MKKLLRLLNSSFLFVVFCLVGCRDKQELGFLGDVEVGKYEIIQCKEYPNGMKDTLKWIGYGPWKEADRYFFDLDTFSTAQYNIWYLQSNYVSLRSSQMDPLVYNSSLSSLSETEFKYSFDYYVNNVNQVSDSASGTLIFKRIDL